MVPSIFFASGHIVSISLLVAYLTVVKYLTMITVRSAVSPTSVSLTSSP